MTIDLYRSSHARLRQQMRDSALATSAALRAADRAGVRTVERRVTEMLTGLRRRSEAESRILHPLIGKALPTVRESLDRQHTLMARLLDHVESVLDAFVAAPSVESASRLDATVQHFVAAVLPHMEEEEALMPLLASSLAAEDLAAAAHALAAD